MRPLRLRALRLRALRLRALRLRALRLHLLRRALARGALVLAGVGACACTSRPAALPARPPLPHEAGAYASPGTALAPMDDVLVRRTAAAEVRDLRVLPRLPEDLAGLPHAGDPIAVRLWLPRGPWPGPRPLVLMSPILANNELVVADLASACARRGWMAAVVQRKDLAFDPDVALERAEDELRLLVLRSRQALDTLLLRPDVDPSRLATCGVSAGAIVSALVAGADPRLTAHAWLLAGGPLADVMTDTSEGRFQRWGAALRARHGWDREEVRRRLQASLAPDPVALARHVPAESVLLVLARGDRSVPTRQGLALWEALGRPRLTLLPGGHYLALAALPWLVPQVTGFLAQRLEGPPACRGRGAHAPRR
ncbi:MAG: alpha/beta hydrolase family protein, partial [Planctomycetia bacterium]